MKVVTFGDSFCSFCIPTQAQFARLVVVVLVKFVEFVAIKTATN